MPLLPLIALAILLGELAGVVTGLAPGVHINLVSAVLLALAPTLGAHFPLMLVGAFIVSMSITHAFLDTLPSVFLGAPDEATALGVLPGHRYLLRGDGLAAVRLAVLGGILGTLLTVALFVPCIWLIAALAEGTKAWLFWILLAFTLFTIAKDRKRAWALVVFALSGLLGVVVLRLPLDEPLLPLLSGMFGAATLLYSVKEKNRIPEQRDARGVELDARRTALGTALGAVGGFLTALFPGISSAMAAALVSQGSDLGDRGFLVLIGSLGSASFVLSLAAWIGIGKARNGAMAVVVQMHEVTPHVAMVLLSCALIATGIAALLALRMGKGAAWLLPRIPYAQTCLCVVGAIALITYLRCGWLGLLVLAASTAIGLLPAALKTARAQAMGALMLPLLVALW